MINKIKRLFFEITSKNIVKDMSWYTTANIISNLFGFIGVFFVSRYLGPTNLGLYAFVINYVSTFFTIFGGSDLYFTWEISRSEDIYKDIKEYVIYKLYLFLSIFLVVLLSAFIVLPKDVAILVVVFMLPMVVYSLSAFAYYALSIKKAKLVSIINIASNFVFLLVKLLLVFISAKLSYFVFFASFESVLGTTAIAFYFLREKDWREKLSMVRIPNFIFVFHFLNKVKSSIVVVIVWQLLLRADQLFLATVSNAYSLGIYSAAVKLAELPNFFAGVLYSAMIGRMAGVIGENHSYGNKKLRILLGVYFFIGLLFSLIVILFAPVFVNIIYGSKFSDSVNVLRVYAISIPFFYLLYFFYLFLGAAKRYLVQAIVLSVSVVLNIVLVVIITPIYGLVGTAVATVVSYALGCLLFYFFWIKKM